MLILPLLFLFIGINYQYTEYGNDPNYIYLMNAVSLANGDDAGHIDNPGTPVMEIGAIVIWIQDFLEGDSAESLQYKVLKDPERFVSLFRHTFITLIGLAFIITGWIVFVRTGNIYAALVFQIVPFLSVNVLEISWTKTSPEPILLVVTTFYVALLVIYYFNTKRKPWFFIVLFSLLGGLGLATKATYLPLLVIPLFLIKGWKHNLWYFLGTVAFFFLFTSPAHAEYHRMIDWFLGFLTHKGMYGGGEKGFIDISVYFSSVIEIFRNNLFLSIILLVSIVTIVVYHILKRKKSIQFDPRNIKILTALICATIIGILIVAKHYHKNHYLFPVLALSGVILFFSVELMKTLFKKKFLEKWIFGLFLLVVLVVFSLDFLPLLRLKYNGYADTNKQFEQVTNIINNKYRNSIQIIHYPDAINKLSALNFGNGYSKLNNQEALSAIYPQAYFYNVVDNTFRFWQFAIPYKQIFGKHGLDIIFTGMQMNDDDILALNDRGIYVNNVFKSKFQAIYELDTIKTSRELKMIAAIGKKEIFCNAEVLTDDGLNFLAGKVLVDGGKFQSGEMARSGEYSMRMTNNTEFGFNVLLDELYPGQEVECSVWRYSVDNEESYLIASAEDSDIFYRGNNEVTKIDNEKWEKLYLKFTIPNIDPPLEKLLIYVWNKGKGEVYFDDLKIILD